MMVGMIVGTLTVGGSEFGVAACAATVCVMVSCWQVTSCVGGSVGGNVM